jgi:hypothetical protein
VKLLKILIIAGFILALGAFFYALPRLIKVKAVSCRSQFGPCSGELNESLTKFQGKNLSEAKRGISELLKSERLVSDFSYQLKLPSTLEVDILQRKASFAIVNPQINTAALLDRDGAVIKLEETTNLPYLETDETPPNLGERVSDEKLFLLNIIYEMFSTYQVKSGKLENGYMQVNLPSGIRVIFPEHGDKDVLLGSLALILSKLNSEDKDTRIENENGTSIIDLRFKNPVLK